MNPDISRMLPLFGGLRIAQPVVQCIAANELSAADSNVREWVCSANSTVQKIRKMCLRATEDPSHFREYRIWASPRSLEFLHFPV
jgi:hypothetical protein